MFMQLSSVSSALVVQMQHAGNYHAHQGHPPGTKTPPEVPVAHKTPFTGSACGVPSGAGAAMTAEGTGAAAGPSKLPSGEEASASELLLLLT